MSPARHLNHSTGKTPARTGGEDRPTGKCLNAWAAYEVLMHETRGPEFRGALTEARGICGLALNEAGEVVTTPDTCPLVATCLVGSDEQWAKAILARTDPAPHEIDRCGTPAGARWHYRHGQKPCDRCRAANAADSRQRMRERRAAA